MSAISGLGAGTNTSNDNAVAKNGATGAEGLSTMFLDLLVAQISHQNPLDPMDGTQYVSQLAEFANVESLQSLRIDSGKNLELQASQQALQATALIGQQVDVAADTILLEQAAEVKGAVNLGVEAQSVTVRLYNAQGQLMQQQELPFTGIGTLRFAFEQQDAGGYYVQADANINGKPQPLTTLLSGEVERVSVGSNKDDIILQVNGLGNHALLDTNQLAFGGNS
ncbi:flagellar hook assembly protein FlgD [Rheinheimera sp.]|uniref:flagellar hook assembly protein FlgD n=1 Tax=Rheinheimera sp. TaxID=1869214 RepID=UPI002735C1F2|nr:flagellar hook capping FlgD N-terminal domain-containing protein [Rheinheimera sp.]MDP2716698.1 flagellar hook capping FlgD N-terminal domain-containing protein [Rheinheimera sp.]